MWGNGMMYGYQGGMGWMVLGLVFWVAAIAAIVLLVLWMVGKSGKRKGEQVEDTAREILDKRYARGEITKEQYGEMKKELLTK